MCCTPKTRKKERALKKLGYKLVTIWEHQFKQQINQNVQLQEFISQLDVETRLNPRDSFFGGRNNACRLYYEAKPDEVIRYLDFTSLYPYVNKYARYRSNTQSLSPEISSLSTPTSESPRYACAKNTQIIFNKMFYI